ADHRDADADADGERTADFRLYVNPGRGPVQYCGSPKVVSLSPIAWASETSRLLCGWPVLPRSTKRPVLKRPPQLPATRTGRSRWAWLFPLPTSFIHSTAVPSSSGAPAASLTAPRR